MGVLALALGVGGLLVSAAPARPTFDAPLIRINASIGDVSLHMTRADVEARYGAPESSLAVVVPGGTGALVRYRPHGGLLLVTYNAVGRVAALETDSKHYRTTGGVGPGTAAAGARRLAGFHLDYCSLGYWNGDARSDGTDIVTIFTVAGNRIDSVQIMEAQFLASCAGTGELTPEVGAGGFTLTTTVEPPGSGWIRSTPSGIDCPLNCSATFPTGTIVTMEWHPSADFLFDGWSGVCVFLDPCVLRVDGPTHLVASFRPPPPPPPPPPVEEEPPPPGEEEPPPEEDGGSGE